ncbi:ubiquitin carboxyl-terminal hydrolase MINDY-2-like isoform X2 [Acanthaster planci]|uniref:Ubiquitin carboxyl-terminal hydrolase n=1 Tax=Acanthaster planci TaxID=133434 RepID=A0A8B7YRG1_ACAPL|nr:ubiquitin carboxyl-terminal hydrolase MINDY-2-like isoform X2 [Acanthaster planci]
MASTRSEEIPTCSSEGVYPSNVAALKQNVATVEAPPCENGTSTDDATPRAGGDEEISAGAKGGMPTVSDTSPRSHTAEQTYHVKWIKWRGNNTPIITQNENGPCPLIAIMNVLLLRGTIHIPQMVEMVSASQLVGYLGDCLLNRSLENASEGVQRNYEQNIHDAMEIITKLSTGLDVNVKFTGVKDFEYTQECVVFDLLNIVLCHGWLYDPQNTEIVSAVGTCSYNQVVEKIIASKSSKDENEQHQGLVAEQFLESTAAQLTFYGLCELNAATEEGELCVFFRNNHFSTLIKHSSELCILVTDQGFLTESNIVWETLSSVEGDSGFVDGEFNPSPPTSHMAPGAAVNMSPDQQLDADYLVALSLQQDQQQEARLSQHQDQDTHVAGMASMSDHELALQLQEQEDRRLAQNLAQEERQAQQEAPPQGAQAATPPQPVPANSTNSHHKEKSCTLL